MSDNEILNFFVTLLGDFVKMFTTEIKTEMMSIMPNNEQVIMYIVASLFVILCLSKILKTSIFSFIGTIIKTGVILILTLAVVVISIL